jgi:hypothetical protein
VWLDEPAFASPVSDSPPQRISNVLGQDVSEAGIRILSYDFFPVESRLRLDIRIEGPVPPIQTVGEVVWAEKLPGAEHWRIGLKFTEMGVEARSHLQEIVRERPPAPSVGA